MRLFAWQWLATSSLLFGALAATAETRPQYGGTLHVAMHAAPQSLDPADPGQADSFARRNLSSLLFDKLVITDEAGRVQPSLAESWQTSKGNQLWQFRVRHGVTFHDGRPLSAEIVAASLRYANPSWTVTAENDTVVIDSKIPNPELLAELSLARNSILRRDAGKVVDGTGPFSIVEWQPGKTLKLATEGNYWGGRPFVDGVEISMGRDYRDEMTALQLGRADLIELAPEQSQRVSQQGARVASSAPMELLAIVFSREVGSPEEQLLREALALSVERESIRSVLLQGVGQPAGSLLPTWMSGYGFVFPASADLARARQLRSQVHNVPTWKMGYDPSDAMSRVLAERVALNARDAGLSLQPTSSATADMRLVRIPLASFDPWIAFSELSAQIGVPPVKTSAGSVEELYAAEQAALAAERLIPLFHLPVTYASAPRLRNWSVRADGGWDLADAWLEAGTP